jgi:hypothetical protein
MQFPVDGRAKVFEDMFAEEEKFGGIGAEVPPVG